MVVHNIVQILVVFFLFIMVDVHHSKSRTAFPESIPLLGRRVGLVLKLDEQFLPTGLEFVHLHLHTRHGPLFTCQVYIDLLVSPLVNELGDKVGQVTILMNLHNQGGEEEF